MKIQLDALKADNDMLIACLKDTSEYADLEDAEIIKAAKTLNQAGSKGFGSIPRSGSSNVSSKPKLDNDWIPTEAVAILNDIKESAKSVDKRTGKISESCVSKILYELNAVWRKIMRKECDAIKKRLTG